MSFEECGLPADIITAQCKRPKGLVLVTGATGSGKSTTLASMIDWINKERDCHIITVEDPIEFVHFGKKAIVDQREVGQDTHSFGAALKHVLRQDPDVILIGEMRDLETIESALIIAETGHLVFATLHTSDCVQTINRVIDVFPSHQQQQIRTQLSFVLNAILSQQLIPKAGGRGRVLAVEVAIVNPAIRSLIREAKIHQLYSVIQTSQKEGMRTMNQALFELTKKGLISYEEASARTMDQEELKRLFGK
jgi:twitching motility protein PilT